MTKVLFVLAVVPIVLAAAPASAPTIDAFLSPGYPTEIVSAKKADRIAWTAYERGRRNVYTAAAPAFAPVRLTNVTKDDGVELSDLAISDDGRVVTFVRGTAPNRAGWVADPTSNPAGAERTVWAVSTAGGAARDLGEVTTPKLSPDGRSVVFARDGQIFNYRTSQAPAASRPIANAVPLIKAWGTNRDPVWSPDGTKVAFVSDRVDHSFIGIYDMATKDLRFLAPSVDHDTSPTWSLDSTRVAFIRRPGTPFGQQAHQGSGGIGNPDGPAYDPLAALRGGGGRGGRGRGQQSSRGDDPRAGLYASAFAGGYTMSFWVGDAATGSAHEFWHDTKDDKEFNAIAAIEWADADHVIFQAEPQEWTRWYSVSVSSAQPRPVTLTPGDGAVEAISVSSDGKQLFYETNAGDIERRHIWKVPTAGGDAEPVTHGETIETYPAVLASGAFVAELGGDAKRPFGVGIVSTGGGSPKYVYPPLDGFPTDAEVVPQLVITKAPDGTEIHNQIFLPKDLRPGERRPAIVFVHGGPVRQMCSATTTCTSTTSRTPSISGSRRRVTSSCRSTTAAASATANRSGWRRTPAGAATPSIRTCSRAAST